MAEAGTRVILEDSSTPDYPRFRVVDEKLGHNYDVETGEIFYSGSMIDLDFSRGCQIGINGIALSLSQVARGFSRLAHPDRRLSILDKESESRMIGLSKPGLIVQAAVMYHGAWSAFMADVDGVPFINWMASSPEAGTGFLGIQAESWLTVAHIADTLGAPSVAQAVDQLAPALKAGQS